MSNIQKQHKISPAIAWLTIQKFIIFYCPLDGEHTNHRLYGFFSAKNNDIHIQISLFRKEFSCGWGTGSGHSQHVSDLSLCGHHSDLLAGFSPCSMSVLNKQFAVPVCILASIHHSRLIPFVLNRYTFFTKPSIAVLLPDSKRYFSYFPPLSAYPGSYIRRMLKFAL